MRTSDLSFFVLSSMVLQVPAGVAWPKAGEGCARQHAGGEEAVRNSGVMAVHPFESVQKWARSKSIIAAEPERAVRMRAAVSGSSLAK